MAEDAVVHAAIGDTMSHLVRKYPLLNYKGKTYEVLDEAIDEAISHGSAAGLKLFAATQRQ